MGAQDRDKGIFHKGQENSSEWKANHAQGIFQARGIPHARQDVLQGYREKGL